VAEDYQTHQPTSAQRRMMACWSIQVCPTVCKHMSVLHLPHTTPVFANRLATLIIVFLLFLLLPMLPQARPPCSVCWAGVPPRRCTWRVVWLSTMSPSPRPHGGALGLCCRWVGGLCLVEGAWFGGGGPTVYVVGWGVGGGGQQDRPDCRRVHPSLVYPPLPHPHDLLVNLPPPLRPSPFLPSPSSLSLLPYSCHRTMSCMRT
jgi:hypothetical protein